MAQARRGLPHPLRSLETPVLASSLDKRPPAFLWTERYDSIPDVYNLTPDRNHHVWRQGPEPRWWAIRKAQESRRRPKPVVLNPDQQKQVDGVLGQLRSLLARNKDRMIDTFLKFDANNSGSVDRKEFILAVANLGIVAHKQAVSALFDVLDTDRGGSIDYRELNDHLGIRMQQEFGWNTGNFHGSSKHPSRLQSAGLRREPSRESLSSQQSLILDYHEHEAARQRYPHGSSSNLLVLSDAHRSVQSSLGPKPKRAQSANPRLQDRRAWLLGAAQQGLSYHS